MASNSTSTAVPSVTPLISIHYYGLVVETMLLGIYMVMASITFWTLNERRKEGNSVSKIIVACCVNIFFCTVIHWAGTLYQVYEGIVIYATRPDISIPLMYGSTTPVAIMRLTIFGIAGLTLDTMLIYRLWVVWGRRLIIVIAPLTSTCIGLIGSIMIIVFAATTPIGTITPALRISITTSFSLHAATNILCTSLMVIKIFRNSGGIAASKGQLMSLVWVIVESAAIYTALSLCLMSLLISAQPAALLFADIQPGVIGITSSLLIVRVAAGSATSSGQHNSNTHSRSRGNSLFPGARSAGGGIGSRFEDLPMKVSITRHAHVTRDDDNDMEHKMDLGNFPETPGSGANTSVSNSVNGAV